jgi:ATP-dependent DNA ligase
MGAFDLIELNGDDLRREPLQVRKATLASALIKAARVCASTSITKLTGRDRVCPRLQNGP